MTAVLPNLVVNRRKNTFARRTFEEVSKEMSLDHWITSPVHVFTEGEMSISDLTVAPLEVSPALEAAVPGPAKPGPCTVNIQGAQ